MKNIKNVIISGMLMLTLIPITVQAKEVIHIKSTEKNVTSTVREAIENAKEKDLKIIFEKGIYKFSPKYALSKYCAITNHGNGYKKVIFSFNNFESVEIEGSGSEFIFHGQAAPFQFENCNKVTVQNLSIDWDIPFIFEAKVIQTNKKEGWMDLKPLTKGYSWKFKKNYIEFPNIDGFNFHEFGHTHCFDPKTKSTAHGAHGLHLKPNKIEKLKNGNYRFYEKLRNFPITGSIIASKGEKAQNRYAPAFQTKSSKNVTYNQIVVHHALGMGFLFERTENITISGGGVYTRDGSDRYISSTADATHFANCKGDILVENCRIEGMLDDGTNVHGTYVKVDKIINKRTVRVALHHFEQFGFKFAEKGDEVWFIQQPSSKRGQVNEIVSTKFVNDIYSDLTFKNDIPSNLEKGNILENKTWNPTFTMKGCKISKHRARNIMIKTPKKIIIENNYFSSEMSSIGLRGETFKWYESGAVEDVIIRNNHFVDCSHGGAEHAILWVSPKLGKTFDKNELYDRNIRFENNLIETFDRRIVWANRLENFTFKGNTIKQTSKLKQLYPDAYMFDFVNCKNVEIIDNNYTGNATKFVKADAFTEKTLKVGKNKGFSKK